MYSLVMSPCKFCLLRSRDTQYQKALEFHPNDSRLMYLLGWSYVYNGMYDKGSEQIVTLWTVSLPSSTPTWPISTP